MVKFGFGCAQIYMSEIGSDNNKDVLPVNIEDELRQSYLDYAMSVIVGRALPDVRDGLKPGISVCCSQ